MEKPRHIAVQGLRVATVWARLRQQTGIYRRNLLLSIAFRLIANPNAKTNGDP